jgi:hypothetical protein
MSDIPELDRLIEESENVRRNQKWRRQDRRFKAAVLSMILFFNISLLSFFVLPTNIFVFVVCFFFVLILFPLLYEASIEIISELIKDDWEGVDMTKRYHRK